MVELATPLVPAREAPRAPKRDRWVGAGRALAGEIWGVNYVGTAPSYGVPVTSPPDVPAGGPLGGSVFFAVGAGRTTPVISPQSLEDLYWEAFRPLTSEIGVTIWEGERLISLPAGMTPPEPDLVFWTSESLGMSSILLVAEAKLSPTDPADVSHTPAWRRVFQAQSRLQQPTPERQPDAARDVYSELRALVEWMRLPVEQLGEMLGASRRTMYNWLAGRPIRDEAQSRIFRLRDAIAEIAASRDPALVRAWLLRGDPSPATLAAEERWDEFEARIRDEKAPLRPIDQMPQEAGGEPRPDAPEVLKAALVAFSTAAGRTTTRRPTWRPREITGIEGEDEEDAE